MAGNVFVSNGLLSRDCGVYCGQYNVVVFPDGVVANPRELFGWNAKLVAVGNTTYAGYATTTAVLLASIFSMQSGPSPGNVIECTGINMPERIGVTVISCAPALSGASFENNTDCLIPRLGRSTTASLSGSLLPDTFMRAAASQLRALCPPPEIAAAAALVLVILVAAVLGRGTAVRGCTSKLRAALLLRSMLVVSAATANESPTHSSELGGAACHACDRRRVARCSPASILAASAPEP